MLLRLFINNLLSGSGISLIDDLITDDIGDTAENVRDIILRVARNTALTVENTLTNKLIVSREPGKDGIGLDGVGDHALSLVVRSGKERGEMHADMLVLDGINAKNGRTGIRHSRNPPLMTVGDITLIALVRSAV
jgi:hypothetical protein